MTQKIVKVLLLILYFMLVIQAISQLIVRWDWLLAQSLSLRIALLIAILKMSTSDKVDASLVTTIVTVLHFSMPVFLIGGGISELALPVFGRFLFSIGFVVTFFAIVDLGSSFALLPTATRLISTGIYRFVRHPMYAGYIVMLMGWVIEFPSYSNIFIIAVTLILTHFRILFEERQMSIGGGYLSYKSQVRYRLCPKVY